MAGTTLLTADAILFSINAAIRLSGRFRKAYAKSIRAKKLTLPLPDYSTEVSEVTAFFFFNNEGAHYLDRIEALNTLHLKLKNQIALTDSEIQEYTQYFISLAKVERGQASEISTDELVTFFTIQQFKSGTVKPNSVLKLVAGSIVELGIDYFNQVPGALNLKSAKGRAIKSFLEAFDTIPFAETENLKRELSLNLVPRLFAATAEAVTELSPVIVNDEGLQQLIKATGKGVATDIFKLIDQGRLNTFKEQEEVIHWGQSILTSMVKSAGNYTFSHSSELFGTNHAISELVDATGSTLLDAILEDNGQGINLKTVFTQDALDQVVQSAFYAISEFPDWISRKKGVQAIVSGVSEVFAETGIRRPGLAPECIRLLLEQTALNIDLFQTEDGEQFGEHLLITGLRSFLQEISKPPVDGQWRPHFSNTQVLDLIHTLTDEIVFNPTWVTKSLDQQSLLNKIIQTTFSAFAHVPKTSRFSAQTFQEVLQLNLKAVAQSPQFLNKVNWGSNTEEAIVLDKALDLTFAFTFHRQTSDGPYQLELMSQLLDYSLNIVMQKNPNKKGLILLDAILYGDTGLDFSNGLNTDLGDQLMASAMRVLDEHPELIVNDQALKGIISDTASVLRTTMPERADLLPEVIRLLLDHTAGHLAYWTQGESDKMNQLLVSTFKQTLHAIAAKPTQGKWKPQFSSHQILEVMDTVTLEAMENPSWNKNETVVLDTLNSIFNALETVPQKQQMPFVVVEMILRNTFNAVSAENKLLIPLTSADGTTQTIAIDYSLKKLMVVLYDDQNDTQKTWNISNVSVFQGILDQFLAALSKKPVNQANIDATVNDFSKVIKEYQTDVIASVDELLDELQANA